MTTPLEAGGQSPSWAEQFKATHPIERLPREARAAFSDLLDHRAATRDYYTAIPAGRFDEGIGQGDSPKKELGHQIDNTRARAEAINTSSLAKWGNSEVLASLQLLDRDQLVGELDSSTESLYEALDRASMHGRISLPYGKSASTGDFLWGAVRHDVLHLGMAIKFGDYFGIERPPSVKKLYG